MTTDKTAEYGVEIFAPYSKLRGDIILLIFKSILCSISSIMIFSLIGALIIGALMTIFSITSFWTYRSNEIIWSFYRIHTLTEYPISIYNKFIQIILTYILPFAFVAYYPTMCYLGLNTYMIYLSPIVAILLWIIAVILWNLALNKYRSTGN